MYVCSQGWDARKHSSSWPILVVQFPFKQVRPERTVVRENACHCENDEPLAMRTAETLVLYH